jgi:hypothetical protein
MTLDDITAVLIDELGRIAPEIDARGLDPDADLHGEFDIDSMDFLNLVTALGGAAPYRYSRDRLSEPRHIRPRGRLLAQRLGTAA